MARVRRAPKGTMVTALASDWSAARIKVEMADMKISARPGGVLDTGSLGAGMALSIYDPQLRIGGILHFMLPDSGLKRNRAQDNPFVFADTGIPQLFHGAYKLGAAKERLVCRMVGGAALVRGGFGIGAENAEAARRILERNHVRLAGELTGGVASISISLDLGTGRIQAVKSNGEVTEL